MSLLDLLDNDGGQARPVRRIDGVVVGVVSDNRDPQQLARVKLRLPSLAAGVETDWVKIATLYAGGDRGTVFLPEIDDEVLVVFEHGDLNHPYVIGSLWNTRATPPEVNADGDNNLKIVKSRSGHTITFCDDASGGAEKVEIRSNAGHVVTLSDASGAEEIVIQDKSGQNVITLKTQGNVVSVQAGTKLTLEAPTVEIKAQTFSLSADATASLTANASLSLRGMPIELN